MRNIGDKSGPVAPADTRKCENPGYRFRWTAHREELCPMRTGSRRSHADPTADAAIGNIIREEKRRKRKKQGRKKHTGEKHRRELQREELPRREAADEGSGH